MKKFSAFLLILFCANYAYGGLFTEDSTKNCDSIELRPILYAVFEPNEYICANGYYLPANHEGCEPCPVDHTCSGGTFNFDEIVSQGITYNPIITTGYNYGCDQHVFGGFYTVFEPNSHTCTAGTYLPAGVDACTQCPAGNFCVGGTYSFNETTDQGIVTASCDNGYNAPAGSATVSDCVPNIIHITWQGAELADVLANHAETCTYGGDLRTPVKAIHIPGMTFVGWTVAPQSGN